MSLTKRNEVLFPALMNEIFRPDWFGGTQNVRTTTPAVNIKENEKDFELDLFVPGRAKKDFKIEIDDTILTISTEIEESKEVSEQNFTRREFTLSSFKRAFTLPDTVATDKIEASYEPSKLAGATARWTCTGRPEKGRSVRLLRLSYLLC